MSPVVFEFENAVLIGPFNQGRQILAAIQHATFQRLAPPPLVDDHAAPGILAALSSDPRGILVAAETADDPSIEAEMLER